MIEVAATVLDVEGAPRFLLSEALRGEGARLVTAAGEPFMTRYHPSGDLAPRDIVSRSIVLESQRPRDRFPQSGTGRDGAGGTDDAATS
jgi:L-aspartate oxidase